MSSTVNSPAQAVTPAHPVLPPHPTWEDRGMNRLWAWTLIFLAAGLGFSAGMLLILFLFVMPESAESRLMKEFPFQEMLRAAGPANTSWDILDPGTDFSGYSGDGGKTRRFLAEAAMNRNDQSAFENNFRNQVNTAFARYQAMNYGSGSGSSSGSRMEGDRQREYQRSYSSYFYSANGRNGTVLVTIFGEGDRVIIQVVVTER